MFCEQCGSQIPDGAKFCTACGAPLDQPEAVQPPEPTGQTPEPSEYQTPEPVYHTPEPTAYQTPEAPAYQAPEPSAYQTPEAPSSPSPGPSAPANDLGYSVVGGGSSGSYSAAQRRVTSPEIESKPLTKRWWFWLIIGLVVVAVIIAIAASALTARKDDGPVVETASSNSLRSSFSEHAVHEAPEPDVPDEPAAPAPEDGDLTLEECVAYIEQDLADAGYYTDFETDEDDWVYAYIWFDGINDLADAAYDGDGDALAEWEDLLDEIVDLSAEYEEFFADHGQPQAVSYVGLQDEADFDLVTSVAISGELVFDWVTGVDVYDLLEE